MSGLLFLTRPLAEQEAGLRLVQALVPEAVLGQHPGEPELADLRVHDREVLYTVGGYDCWRSYSRGTHPRKFSVTAEEAAAFLKG